jgi:catechol 2,3-dioxygenase
MNATPAQFKPTRLGHVNMFVSNVERASGFYANVAGIELVKREAGIRGAFHSNGNTHHDVGLIETKAGERRGIGGFRQVSSFRGVEPGLNHFGWEMASEADLIAALQRVKDARIPLANASNHQIAHSAYIVDPDGNYHEFYADAMENWRTVFNLENDDLITEAWDWEGAAPGMGPMPGDPSDRRRVAQAVFHPSRVTHATLSVRSFEETSEFLRRVAGLRTVWEQPDVALFGGARSSMDLVLISSRHGDGPGLVGVSFLVEDPAELDASRSRAAAAGVAIIAERDLPHKHSVLVRDPDNVLVEFYSPKMKGGAVHELKGDRKADRLWMFDA